MGILLFERIKVPCPAGEKPLKRRRDFRAEDLFKVPDKIITQERFNLFSGNGAEVELRQEPVEFTPRARQIFERFSHLAVNFILGLVWPELLNPAGAF